MIIHVALPIPVNKAFSYGVPHRWVSFVKPLLRARVPFKNKDLVGFIVGVEEGDGKDLKEIYEIIDPFPMLDENAIKLAEWASHYYLTPKGLVLRYALPVGLPFERYLTIQATKGTDASDMHGLTLKKALGRFRRDTVFDYYQKGFLLLSDTVTNKDFVPFSHERAGIPVEKVLFCGGIADRLQYYVHIVERHINNGENVLMLVPDHHSVGQFFFDRLSERFPGRTLRYGSSVTVKKRMEAYLRARNEGGYLILGSRSCLFMPVFRNSHIIVERPEEDEYRNEEGFRFNAVNLALQRAEIEGVPIVLGSVSPPLEVFKRAIDGELTIIEKTHPKPNNCHEIITEKGISSLGDLPDELTALIKRSVEDSDTIAIYTPRKDYSSRIKCLDCKNLFRCPACGGVLSYQRHRDVLTCNSCGRTFPYKDRCLECGSNLIHFSNIGVEYLEQKLKDVLPDVPIIRVTGDTLRKNKDEFKGLCHGNPAIIIGTQALSKPYGLHANKLILIEWEELMRVGSYRAGEKMFHALSSLIDSLEPDELYACMTRKKRVSLEEFLNVRAFCNQELTKRANAQFPPYVRIFLVEVEKENESAGIRLVEKVKSAAAKHGVAQHITGPLVQKRKRYHWRMIIKGNEGLLHEYLSEIHNIPGVQVKADPVEI